MQAPLDLVGICICRGRVDDPQRTARPFSPARRGAVGSTVAGVTHACGVGTNLITARSSQSGLCIFRWEYLSDSGVDGVMLLLNKIFRHGICAHGYLV